MQLTVGGIAKEQLLRRLSEAGIQFNKYALTLFQNPLFSPPEKSERVSLVNVTISELGIDQACLYSELVARAATLGLKLCPLYLGAFLRLEFLDQPEGRYLTIASAKPVDDEKYPNGFYLRNFDNALWLRGYRATTDFEFPVHNEFVFMKD